MASKTQSSKDKLNKDKPNKNKSNKDKPNKNKPWDILVILGGVSPEREVSRQTGEACAQALRARGYEVRIFDWRKRDVCELMQALLPQPDLVFNALHGTCGEDGCLYGLLECCAIPTTHSATLASAIAMDKIMTKRLLQPIGIRFPDSKKLGLDSSILGEEDTLACQLYPAPYIIKPIAQGSSVGVIRVLTESEKPKLSSEFSLMVERYIPGREFTVGVFQPVGKPPRALGITEIVASATDFYDYNAKYNKQLAAKHIFPAKIEPSLAETMCNWSKLAHESLGCSVISRCDFRYNPQEAEGENLYMLEINTHPGMTDMSLVPEQARGAGIEFEEMIETLVLDAWGKRSDVRASHIISQRRQA